MKTIIKAILRFFKYSKLSFVGLFLLILFSSATFNTLNNLTINLNTSYKKISSEGNLHDFVINENFRYGQGEYSLNKGLDSETGTINIKSINIMNESMSQNPIVYNVTFELNKNLANNPSSNFYWTYAYNNILNSNNEKFKTFLMFDAQIESSSGDINITNWRNNQEFVNNAISIVDNKKALLNDFVKNEYKSIYLTELEQNFDINTRSFNSINISNTKQKMFFKVIEQNPNFEIDKLVLYEGNNLTTSWDTSKLDINSYSSNDFVMNKDISREIVPYLYKAKWSNPQVNFDDLYNYTNENKNYNPYTNTNEGNYVTGSVESQSKILKRIIDTKGINNKGYAISFSYTAFNTIPISGTIEDYTSYEAIISPEYLAKMNKKPVNIEEWRKHQNDKQKDFDVWLNSLSEENKIKIDNQTFVVLGTGVSPDFMYPILSFQNVVPNTDVEQIVYTNTSGYFKMLDAFRGNEQENFIVGKFKSENEENNIKIIDEINMFNKGYMAWPDNIKSTYLANDLSNTLSPSALRLEFIPKIVLSITTVSAFLTTFISLLSIFISIVIIQRFIQINRNSLGIMQANGYKKREIIIGICLLISIPVTIATFLGYIIGFSVQSSAISILKNFWTLPTPIEPLSLSTLIPLLFFVIILFLLITALFSWFSLRGETAEFMKDDAKYKMSKSSEFMKRPFKKFNIIVRFRAAIAFTSLWRVLLLSIMSAGLSMSLTFSLNSLNAFKNAATETFGPKNYSYSINLISPTLQSGQYYAVPYNSQGIAINNKRYFNELYVQDLDKALGSIDDISHDDFLIQDLFRSGYYKNYLDKNNPKYNEVFYKNIVDFGNTQLVSQNDATEQNENLMYLKYKSTTKPFVDLNLGLGSLSTNPWDLASQLMPPNNANYANQSFITIFEKAVASNELINIGIKNANQGYEYKSFYEYIKQFSKFYAVRKNDDTTSAPSIDGVKTDEIKIVSSDEIKNNLSAFYSKIDSEKDNNFDYYYEFDGKKTVTLISSVSIDFLNLLFEIYKNKNFRDYGYSINYGKVVVGSEVRDNQTYYDSPYSYMEFKINKVNGHLVNYSADNFKSVGLLRGDERVAVKEHDKVITNRVWDEINETKNGIPIYPVIINKYAYEVYGLKMNDLIEVDIQNSADRYSRKYYNVNTPISYLKVVGIATTYQGAEFYMSQYDVNKSLGLTINNIKPKVPKSANEIKPYVDWENLEYDVPNKTTNADKNDPQLKKNNFNYQTSGFNGLFSKSLNDLKEVTAGVSLYSVSGIYPGVDRIDKNNETIKSIFTNPTNGSKNLESIIEITGFTNLKNSSWQTVIDNVANVFGTSASFSIISGADSKFSSLNVINTISATATDVQNIIMGIIILITIVIVVVISSIIINDSMKLAAILKCLGLADRNNALSFLSIYFPVFLIGLAISIPFSYLIYFFYSKIILGFTGILLVYNSVWWHYVVAELGVILIFALSYWATWNKISEIDLTNSIK